MIRSVRIRNFRGIGDLSLSGARRINILVGPNGSGKTSFLEGLYCAAGASPELLLRTRSLRGREVGFTGGPDQLIEALWSDIFADSSLGRAEIDISGDSPGSRSLLIERLGQTRELSASGETARLDTGLRFEWTDSEGNKTEFSPKIENGAVQVQSGTSPYHVHFIPARSNLSEAESARAYSKLRLSGEAELFEKAFLSEFPILSGLSVEAPSGLPVIYGKMKSDGRMLPLSMISGGINHLAGMMLRLSSESQCLMLIDEIENGFYHERYESIWRSLYDLAVAVDGQIFATTHSLECLRALSAALPNNAEEVRFIRTRIETDGISFHQFSGKTLFGSLELGEVR